MSQSKCRKLVNNLREIIRYYIYTHPNCRKNDISYELGLYSGYSNKRKNYLTWSLIMNDKYIIDNNRLILSSKYRPNKNDNELYIEAQKTLKSILKHIIRTIQVEPLGNTEIAKKLDMETFVFDKNGNKKQPNWFTWSCLSILYNFGIIQIHDQNNKLVDPRNKIGRRQIMKKFSIRIENPCNHLINQDKLDAKKKDSYGIQLIKAYLDKYKIEYIAEFKFPDCKDIKELPFDLYLPAYHVIIEFDGGQHFAPVFGFKTFLYTQEHDKMKNKYCLKNGIVLLRIAYTEIDSIKNILNDFFKKLDKDYDECLYFKGKIYDNYVNK